MTILIYLLLFLLVTWYSGLGLCGLYHASDMRVSKSLGMPLIVPVVGMAFVYGSLFYGYYITGDSSKAMYISLLLPTMINICFVIRYLSVRHKSPNYFHFIMPTREDRPLFLVLFAIFLFAAWPYIITGDGYFFFSSNQDIYQIIEKGNKLLTNELKTDQFLFYGRKLDDMSNAFWSRLFSLNEIDAYAISTIFYLLLIVSSIYWLLKYVFKVEDRTAIWISAACVLANFYFSSFLSSHRGSLFYGALAPVFIGTILLWLHKEIRWQMLIVPTLIYHVLDLTYQGPLLFVAAPLGALIIATKLYEYIKIRGAIDLLCASYQNRSRFLKALIYWTPAVVFTCAILSTLYIVAFNMAGNYLLNRTIINNVLISDDSWRLIKTSEMLKIFWGLFPSQILGEINGASLLTYLKMYSQAALVISSVLFGLSIWCAFVVFKNPKRRFFIVYLIFFPLFFMIMLSHFRDPYYIYKYLYLNQFVFVLLIGVWFFERGLHGPKVKRVIVYSFFAFVAVVNIQWNVHASYLIYRRPHHNKEKIIALANWIKKEKLSDIALNIPQPNNYWAINYALRKLDIKLNYNPIAARAPLASIYDPKVPFESRYVIRINAIKNLVQAPFGVERVLYDNGLLSVIEQNRKNMSFVFYRSWEGPSTINDISLKHMNNWLSNLNANISQWVVAALNFVRASNMADRTYLDAHLEFVYRIVKHYSKPLNINLQDDPINSEWFIELNPQVGRLAAGVPMFRKSWDKQRHFSFAPHQDDRIVFANPLLVITKRQPRTSSIVNHTSIDFNALSAIVQGMDTTVYLDVDDGDYLKPFLMQLFSSAGVQLSTSEKSDVVCRTVFRKPFAHVSRKRVWHPEETLIWDSRQYEDELEDDEEEERDIEFRAYDIQLVKMPSKGRKTQHAIPSKTDIPTTVFSNEISWDLSLKLFHLTEEANYVSFLVSPGPSIGFKPFIFNVYANENRLAKSYEIQYPQSLVVIPLKEIFKNSKNGILHFEGANLIGESLLPRSESIINYTIYGLQIVKQKEPYTTLQKKILNTPLKTKLYHPLLEWISPLTKKIIAHKDQDKIFFGIGWSPTEMNPNNVPIKWITDQPVTLILQYLDHKDAFLKLDCELGDSVGDEKAFIDIFAGSKMIASEFIDRPESFIIDLTTMKKVDKKQELELTFVPRTMNKELPEDPRILNFQISGIQLLEQIEP